MTLDLSAIIYVYLFCCAFLQAVESFRENNGSNESKSNVSNHSEAKPVLRLPPMPEMGECPISMLYNYTFFGGLHKIY